MDWWCLSVGTLDMGLFPAKDLCQGMGRPGGSRYVAEFPAIDPVIDPATDSATDFPKESLYHRKPS